MQIIPARMLNEFVYCPRLFYYEHVEGVFVENADTLRGATVHKRVDAGHGALRPPDLDPTQNKPSIGDGDKSAVRDPQIETDTIHSRSVSLGSERLGVTAKLDLVEGRKTGDRKAETGVAPSLDAACDAAAPCEKFSMCPVEYKAGSPREGDEGVDLWPTDRMQLGLQMLLLRENGYSCDRGIIYYRGTKQRVALEMTPDLEAWVLDQITAARNIADGPIPRPLVASPKCVRCSLNSVCLPDETRLLGRNAEFDMRKEECPARVPREFGMPEWDAPRPPGTPSGSFPPGSPFRLPASSSPPTPRLASPRRLMAAREETRVLYLNTPGLRIGQKDERLVVKEEKRTLEEIRINDLTHVALFGNIQISTQAIQTLCENEVPVTYFSMGGWFYGITRGHGMKNIFTRIEQFRLARDPRTCRELARRFVFGKIRNQRTMLMRLHGEPPAPVVAKLKYLSDSAARSDSLQELLGTEGAAAAAYFGEFNGMLKTDDYVDIGGPPPEAEFRFQFSGRNRRPPTDPVNALLSLAYSLLAKDCTLAAVAVGLDPYVGYYHQPRFGRPALALDLMEEFRPIIAESAVLTCLNNRMIQTAHFVRAGQAVNLTTAGRKIFFQVYEQRMNSLITHPVFDYKVSYRRVLELQCRLLARFLTGELPEYPSFLTR